MAELLVALQNLKDGIEELKKLVAEGRIDQLDELITEFLKKEKEIFLFVQDKKRFSVADKEAEAELFDQIDKLLHSTVEELQKWVKNSLQQWQELTAVIDKLKSYQQKSETSYFFDNQS